MDSELNLPVFDRPMDESPSPMSYEQAIEAFEEIIAKYRLREVPRVIEDIPEFKM